MSELKEVFERAGMRAVTTYINSGNVIFESENMDEDELVTILEQAINQHFGLPINVLLRNYDQMKKVITSLPESWQNNKIIKSDVLFLWKEIDSRSILDQLKIKPTIDQVIYTEGALLWSVSKDHVTKTGLTKLIGTPIYKKMTIRNVNTTRKLFQLMDERGELND